MLTGQYSEILRVIGRLLDEREALARAEHGMATILDLARPDAQLPQAYEDVQIVEHESFVRVAWRARNGSAARQKYTDLTLSLLHAKALQLRGDESTDPPGEREELLRTLGQELDGAELSVTGIVEKDDEYFVSGSEAGAFVNRGFRKADLRALSLFRRRLRPDGEGPKAMAVGEPETASSQRANWLVWGD